ncbi:DUF4278 domain-containing protein [Kovacikia minuta CCNUW1]|uniref:DUF4278 domain-containing protein n=1 Tax=Kovacikia minuta TaxID=2931930 RepID=UPI001CCECE57|nr:DUF4278 domain-containing protein [Kovacikia minuta]UBF26748.1 DUF4278 domain-containing protein [Kovacikia minuta CCNUW1]
MKLSYRGVSYESNPSTDLTFSAPVVDLNYRGATYRLNQTAKTEALNAILKYRGVAYHPQPAVQNAPASAQPVPEAVAQNPVQDTIQEKARHLMMNHHRTVKNRQQVLLSRSAAEVGLTANLSSYWNHIQGKIHPSFWATYDRSHTSLS